MSTPNELINKQELPDSMSGYASVNGLKMYYEIHGSGYPLVLIHGGGSTIQTTFGRILNKLAESNKVIAVELQAHGHTRDIDRPLSFQQDADDIAALLNQLNIDKANIFGFSNGASTTLEMAIRHPEVVNRIILASTFSKKSGAPAWFWHMMAHATFEEMPKPFVEAIEKINPDPDAAHKMYQRDVDRMQSFPDIPDEQIKNIQAPSLILLGDQDVVLPEHAVEMHRMIKNSRLAIFPGGHGDYIGEITTPQDPVMIAYTISIIDQFLLESK